ncbi:MAG TPA: hypothetical protein VFY78_09210, partial [Gammaproteobacteria bacterium]|nr:hypothetical protein [Gammaproteobacteria bacterium]
MSKKLKKQKTQMNANKRKCFFGEIHTSPLQLTNAMKHKNCKPDKHEYAFICVHLRSFAFSC